MDQWYSYLQHDEFVIYTYQRSLTHLSEQRLNAPWQRKVFTKILSLHYKILYKKGVENGVADALSRRPHDNFSLDAISCSSPQWLSEVVAGFQ